MSNNIPPPRGRHSSACNVEVFEEFLQGWLVRQERYMDELLSAQSEGSTSSSTEDRQKDLVNRVLNHYHQYYEEKSRIAQHNIFLVFSPHWLSSLERALLWIAGFRPSLAFKLVSDSIHDLSVHQSQRMSGLKEETKVETKMLNNEMARIQESMGSSPLYELARRRAKEIVTELRQVDGEEEAWATIRADLESMMANADLLRTMTAARVVEILNPRQGVMFLTAATQFQRRVRTCGLQIDAERVIT
ncbi:hypothetical protein ACFE04_030241 [Oxalis oulophora]